VRDSRDDKLVQEVRDLCESHAAYSKGIVFGIGCGLGSRLRFSPPPDNRSSECDIQSTGRFIVIRASSIVQIGVTSKCAICFSSKCTFSQCPSEGSSPSQSPVLRAVEMPRRLFECSQMLTAWVVIVPTQNADAI
jgi:hypothetical protein